MTPDQQKNLIESIKVLQSVGESSAKIKKILSLKGKYLSYSYHTEEWLDKFVTQDPAMLEVKRKVRILANCKWDKVPVLIQGPTGTGKELLAQALHGNRGGPFVGINCTSLPATLIESELFGHKKGSFTGSNEDRLGAFEYAVDGTLFLDEIGDMCITMQAKLLRVLEDGKYRRLGENTERYSNARIVAATNKDLKKEEFRSDLYWRLSAAIIETTSLADRTGDVKLIAKETYEYEMKDEELWIGELSSGNVRALRNYILQQQIFNNKDKE